MWDSASRLSSHVSSWEPSVAAACPSPHIRATSSFAKALMRSAEALWIFSPSAAGGNTPGFSPLSPVAVPLWAHPRCLSATLPLAVAIGVLGLRGKSLTGREMVIHGGQVLSSYTHVSDQHSTFGTKVIVPTAREAHYVLDDFPGNATDLPVYEHATDTHRSEERRVGK